jgi:membrane protease YdiL (CAAX protease family)
MVSQTKETTMTLSDTIEAPMAHKPEPGALRTFVLAITSGCAFAIVGLGVWGAVLGTGVTHPGLMPFGVATMAAFLAGAVSWLKWGSWPARGSAFRRAAVRLDAVPLKTFGLSLIAGWSTMLAGFALYVAHRVASGMGGESALALPHVAFTLLLPGLVMAGTVAGVVEEIAFRGFMQTTLERRFGIVPAILVSGFAWALFHTNHSYFGEEALAWFAIFLSVAAMLGTIAHRTRSLLPGIAVHSGFDIAYFVAAGLLQPHFAPIAWVESFASPAELVSFAAVAGVIALAAWVSFFRTTARDQSPKEAE